MKVLFVNPPVIRSNFSNPENDFFYTDLIYDHKLNKIPCFEKITRRLGLTRNIRYGVRAGSRWPWTMPTPPGAVHFPFMMAYAASLLRSKGVKVDIFDAVADNEHSYRDFIAKIKKENADIVVIETSTPTIDIDLW
ncbi:MAG TPA: hypothetical protein PKK26_19680, partial [Candidatus Wallbacteria bacterium]|nr:hypothetical protein [Candidatus Wallbacteria bacterium]